MSLINLANEITHIQPIKQVITGLLVLHEQLNILEHLSIYWYLVIVPDGVLAKEVKFYHIMLAI